MAKTLKAVCGIPSDLSEDKSYTSALRATVEFVRGWYAIQAGTQKSFLLSDPVIEVVTLDRTSDQLKTQLNDSPDSGFRYGRNVIDSVRRVTDYTLSDTEAKYLIFTNEIVDATVRSFSLNDTMAFCKARDTRKPDGTNLQIDSFNTTCIHETGHLLGLSHTPMDKSVMWIPSNRSFMFNPEVMYLRESDLDTVRNHAFMQEPIGTVWGGIDTAMNLQTST